MRHRFSNRKLNRTSEHRKALFKNMLNSLIKYEQITTNFSDAVGDETNDFIGNHLIQSLKNPLVEKTWKS